jgi:hypothetical protein
MPASCVSVAFWGRGRWRQTKVLLQCTRKHSSRDRGTMHVHVLLCCLPAWGRACHRLINPLDNEVERIYEPCPRPPNLQATTAAPPARH